MSELKQPLSDALSVFEKIIESMVDAQLIDLNDRIAEIVDERVKEVSEKEIEELMTEMKEYIDRSIANAIKKHLVALSRLTINKFQSEGE